MGTNFYWISGENIDDAEEEDVRIHIGKRSLAGSFCWDCGCFKKRDSRDLHMGRGTEIEQCACGKWFPPFGARGSKDRVETSACSFTWTLLSHKWKLKTHALRRHQEKLVVDEYGTTFTASEFLDDCLSDVPIEFILTCPFG